MNFKRWVVLNENIEQNWDFWCDTLEKYSQNNSNENMVLNSLKDMMFDQRIPQGFEGKPRSLRFIISNNGKGSNVAENRRYAQIVVRVLKEKNIENYNWFCFSLGCIVSYNGNMHEEDLRASIDETKRRIAAGELPKTEIGRKGWLVIGSESKEHVDESIRRNQQVSKRKQEKLRKLGITLNEDPRLIKVFAEENNFVIYLCPKMPVWTANDAEYKSGEAANLVNERHAILCKYGKGGNFCTADPTGTFHRSYLRNNIYIFHVNNKVKYQFVDCNDGSNRQFMTIENKFPEEIEKDEFNFLVNCGAPINCYNLKTPSASYEDLIRTVSSKEYKNILDLSEEPIFRETSIERVEKYLFKALINQNKSDIKLLFKAGIYCVRANIGREARSQLMLKAFLERLKEYDFAQEIIKYIIEMLSEDRIFQYYIHSSTLKEIVNIADPENIELAFSKIDRIGTLLSDQDYIELIEKHKNIDNEQNQEIINSLAKLDKAPIAFLIAISKDKSQVCNILKGKLESLKVEEIFDLLIGYLKPTYGKYIDSFKREKLTPGVKTKTSAKEMAKVLGKRIVTKIPDPGKTALDSARVLQGGRPVGRLFNLELTKETVKDFIEAIASNHENLSKEDVIDIITAYKSLGIHKHAEKISKLLGKKNLKKLSKHDRYLL